MRAEELRLAIGLMPGGGALLELGAGDGWQAKALQAHGFEVTAIDIDNGRVDTGRHFPVLKYDGSTLPFPDDSFDVVYSSNVLEHIADFTGMQRELMRVLRPHGIGVHCLPTATWRVLTTLGHPLHAIRWGIQRWTRGRGQRERGDAPAKPPLPTGIASLLRMALLSPRHGEHGSLWSEHWLFTRWSWASRFRGCGWRIRQRVPSELCYSGNELVGLGMSIRVRRLLARICGSSTAIYVLNPPSTR